MSVLDTTFFIDLFRRDAGATRPWNLIFSGGVTAQYSAITMFELWLGRLSAEEETFYNNLFLLLEELPLTGIAARQAGVLLRDLAAPLEERLIRDAMVAASAMEHGLPVRTRNLRDFGYFRIAVETY